MRNAWSRYGTIARLRQQAAHDDRACFRLSLPFLNRPVGVQRRLIHLECLGVIAVLNLDADLALGLHDILRHHHPGQVEMLQ